jgi:cation/acetate symporter
MGISPNAFGVVGAIVNFAVAFMVTKATGPAPQEIAEMVDNFRVPAGAGAASDH